MTVCTGSVTARDCLLVGLEGADSTDLRQQGITHHGMGVFGTLVVGQTIEDFWRPDTAGSQQ